LEVADETTVLSGYETHTLVLKDITLSGGAPAAHTSSDFMNGKEGDTMMVNGQVNPVLAMRPGQVQRWKIVNASNARFYKLSLASHSLRVVGTDGGLLDKPYAQSTVLLSPGERVDILVKASSTKGYYKFQALPYNRGAGDSANQQITLMTVNVTGSSLSQSLPATVDSSATRLSVPANAVTRQITLSMGMGMMGGGSATINGIAFSDIEAYTLTSGRETYEVWEIYNQSMMDHPFHQHVNPAQVISISGGDSAYSSLYATTPAWKDTVIVPAMGSVKLLVPVKDYGGTTVFHCHILEHEDMGMMGLWNIQ
jgi:FtsP/CotA-like multicopper oxidase with cupredoxin domain